MEVLEVSEAMEVIRCVLLCMLETAEGRLCLLEALAVLDVMRRVLLYAGGRGGGALFARGTEGAGGHALYAGGFGRWFWMREVLEVMCRGLLCTLEAVESELFCWRCWR